MIMKNMTKVSFNSVFREVNDCRLRYRLLKGSAGSGKSTNLALDYIIKLSDPRYRGANLLVIRKIEASNRDSTFAELQAAVTTVFGKQAAHFWQVQKSPLMLTSLVTGNRIIFRGMRDPAQREKVKSITFKEGKLCWIWVEEATELEPGDVDILDDRLRGRLFNPQLFYQITMSFNPVSSAHWLKERYFTRPSPEVFTHHSTYLDNRFIDQAYYQRMQRRKQEDPDGYRVYGLGLWGEGGGLILHNYAIEPCCRPAEDFDAVYYGQDFGFNHANALLAVGWRDGELFIFSELYVKGLDTTEIIALAEQKGWKKDIEMFCDSAEPDRIRTWQKAGFAAVGVKKGKGSVRAQIDWLKGRRLHIDPSCTNTIRELAGWRWKKDANGKYLDEPLELDDDAMAALRYSIERLRRGKKRGGLTVFK
jgi:phage terminase large subunit